jgi:type VI secretion system ImpC/EvpB family protein
LDELVGETASAAQKGSEQATSGLDWFLQESSAGDALREWLGPLPLLRGLALKRYIAQRLNRDIARIDALLNGQVNAIIHHPDFQKLEASWRSLHYLVEQIPDGINVKLRVLNVSWRELTKDLTIRSLEFDQSQLFRKVYSDEFGTPGGEPFGLLLGDYEIRQRKSVDHPYDDLETLTAISGVAAAAFAPFIASVHPSVLQLTSFAELDRPRNFKMADLFDHLDGLRWRSLRKEEDSRFIGLTLPRVLARLPYADDSARVDGFRFREEVGTPDRRNYLWGNASYAFAGVVIRAFVKWGWFADIRGPRKDDLNGGIVAGLPVHHFNTDKNGVAPKCSTDTIITDAQEKELSGLGFIPLCACQDTDLSAFYGNQSIQQAREWDQLPVTVNARLSAMLQYILCASRFAHYLKVIGRDRVGSFTTPAELQNYLRSWLTKYTTASDKGDATYPLREAKVEVEELDEKPGSYLCRFSLRPHYQLEQLASMLKFESIFVPSKL